LEDRGPRDDKLEELLDELRALRQEGQGIREALERLSVPLTRIESWLTQQGEPTRVSVSPGVQEVLSSGAEGETGARRQDVTAQRSTADQAGPRARPDITPEARAGPTVWQRFYRPINILKESLNRPWVLLKQKIFTVLTIFLVIYGISFIGIFDWVEILFSNVRYAFKGQSQPSSTIALVTVDTRSLQELGPFGKSWRLYHGQVLKNLSDDGVRAVGFDFSFSSPSEYDQAFIEGIDYARRKEAAVVIANQYDEFSQTFSDTISSIRDKASAVGHAYLMKDRVTNLVRWVPLQLEEVQARGPVQIRKSHLSLDAQLATLQGTNLPTANADNNYLTILSSNFDDSLHLRDIVQGSHGMAGNLILD